MIFICIMEGNLPYFCHDNVTHSSEKQFVVCLFVCLNKMSILQFYQKRLRSQMLEWKSTRSERQRKHLADLLLQQMPQEKCPSLKKPPSNSISFLSTSCESLYLSSWLPLTLYGFPNNPVFTSCQLVACSASWPMVDFINPVYNIQSESSCIKGVC